MPNQTPPNQEISALNEDSILASQHLQPLIDNTLNKLKHSKCSVILGITGAQGSGKTTLASYLETTFNQTQKVKAVSLSLDDFYLKKSQREQLGKEIHPLLTTRGVPGTHDIKQAAETIQALTNNNKHTTVSIPRFNKAIDDRLPESQWDLIESPVDIIILEGWCLGSPAQNQDTLIKDVNLLEKNQDPGHIWRKYANEQLLSTYANFFQCIDIWVMLQAPSFDCVYQWRLEQEEKLKLTLEQELQATSQVSTSVPSNEIMTAEQIAQFIPYFQRITEHTLSTLPTQAEPFQINHLYQLDSNRKIIKERHQF